MITPIEIKGQTHAYSQDGFRQAKLVIDSVLKFGQNSETWIKKTKIYTLDENKADKKGDLLLEVEDHNFRKGLSSKQNKIICYHNFFVVSTESREITITENNSTTYYTAYDYTGKTLTQRPCVWNEMKDKSFVETFTIEDESESE